MASSPTRLLCLWHFHQPYYSTPGRGSNTLPWVRLHAIKSYYDLGRMLEDHPGVRCAINFSGSLLEQFREYLEVGKRDSWWHLTRKPAANLTDPDKHHLLRHFFSLDWETCIEPNPGYRRLLEKRGGDSDDLAIEAFDTQEYRDLQVWFNLAWFGFSARNERAVVQSLLDKGEQFSEDEKIAVLEQQIEVMQLLIPLYRKLHRRDQIEISVSPMYHPIMPLVIDTESAERCSPSRPRPEPFRAPEDARHQLRAARTTAREVLGIEVDGIWPSEGAVSPEVVEMFDEFDIAWCASDEEVLAKSRGEAFGREADLYRRWQLEGTDVDLFFRDRAISDQVGFVYGNAETGVAVDDFLERVRRAGREEEAGGEEAEAPIVSVIADGENPWEHYPGDGEAFLGELFGRLESADDLETTTPSRCLGRGGEPGELTHLHSGSWIYANYDIWIGHEETNCAWELLGRTRERLVEEIDEADLSKTERQQTWRALYMAEGSDWFWWYGDDFTSENDADFDRLFRDQLRYVYRMLELEIPAELDSSILGERLPKAPFEAPKRLIKPRVDGRSDYFYEWSGAGVYRNTGAHGSMFENTRYVDEMRVGFDLENLYVQVAPGPDLMAEMSGVRFELAIRRDGVRHRVRIDRDGEVSGEVTSDRSSGALPLELVAFEEVLEFAVPFELLDAAAGDALSLNLSIRDERMERERHPPHGGIDIEVPDESFEAVNWMV